RYQKSAPQLNCDDLHRGPHDQFGQRSEDRACKRINAPTENRTQGESLEGIHVTTTPWAR
ncbi:hypothetical protein THAOC_26612, partial [Thalassiosira oceanica]